MPADCTLRRTSPVATSSAGAGAGVTAGAAVTSGPPVVTTSWAPTVAGFFFAVGCFATTVSSGATGVEADAGTVAPGRTTICVPAASIAQVCRATLCLWCAGVAGTAGWISARPESSGMPAIRGVVVAWSSPPGQMPATGSATAAIAMAHSPAPADPRRRALRLLGDGWGERTCTWTSHSSAATHGAAAGMRRTLGAPQRRHMSRTRTSRGPGPQVGNQG